MYKTEKRFATVGESIIIKNPTISFGRYKKNDILKVAHADGPHPQFPDVDIENGEVLVEDMTLFIHPDEYEVIVGEETEG